MLNVGLSVHLDVGLFAVARLLRSAWSLSASTLAEPAIELNLHPGIARIEVLCVRIAEAGPDIRKDDPILGTTGARQARLDRREVELEGF